MTTESDSYQVDSIQSKEVSNFNVLESLGSEKIDLIVPIRKLTDKEIRLEREARAIMRKDMGKSLNLKRKLNVS